MEQGEMGRIFLLRHAKAAAAQADMPDHERPLERVGRRDAQAVGEAMMARGFLPDTVRCSSAKRTRETWDILSTGWPRLDVEFLDSLFSGDASAYLATAQASPGPSVMLIGHNPMTESLAHLLLPEAEAVKIAAGRGFPTAGLAIIDFEGELGDVEPGCGRLAAFISPRDL